MNYKRIYDEIIQRAVERVEILHGTEKHHIIPVAMGGSNESSNLATLTYREHYLVHWLLSNIHKKDKHHKMHYAFGLMTCIKDKDYKITSHSYALAKKRVSAARKGKPHSEEHRENIGKALKKSQKARENLARMQRGRIGLPHTEEARKKMSKSHKGVKLKESTKRKLAEIGKLRRQKDSTKDKIMTWHMENSPAYKLPVILVRDGEDPFKVDCLYTFARSIGKQPSHFMMAYRNGRHNVHDYSIYKSDTDINICTFKQHKHPNALSKENIFDIRKCLEDGLRHQVIALMFNTHKLIARANNKL